MEEKLKIGDEVVLANKSSWADYTTYTFNKVVRLTGTRAILGNHVQLINKIDNHWNKYGYLKHGDKSQVYTIATDKDRAEAKRISEIRKISYWFSEREFTDAEKAKIYELLNN